MILLLGGTSEAREIAEALVQQGHDVLLSNHGQAPYELAETKRLRMRRGPLDRDSFIRLIREEEIKAVVDATHPYAEEISSLAAEVCTALDLSCVRFERSGCGELPAHVSLTSDHEAAARQACTFGARVLLTIGTRHLAPYVQEAQRSGARLWVRVLDCDASIDSCEALGIPQTSIITGRGPFSEDQNAALIAAHRIGVLVTKDSGDRGGVPEKLAAAARCACQVIMVSRPPSPAGVTRCKSLQELIAWLSESGLRV